MQAETKVFSNRQEISSAAAERWLEIYHESVARQGFFCVALAGGSTPRDLYRTIATPAISSQLDWQRVHLFFGDERTVPPDHPDSNYRMARETLLDHVPIPESNVHRIETELADPELAAGRYQELLVEIVPRSQGGVPQFDLILLGIGPDGHTASLFPETDILQQRERFVAAVNVKQKATWRVSLTFPVLDCARHLLFLVAGADKQQIVRQLLDDSCPGARYPVQMLQPSGSVEFYLDSAAAGTVAGQ